MQSAPRKFHYLSLGHPTSSNNLLGRSAPRRSFLPQVLRFPSLPRAEGETRGHHAVQIVRLDSIVLSSLPPWFRESRVPLGYAPCRCSAVVAGRPSLFPRSILVATHPSFRVDFERTTKRAVRENVGAVIHVVVLSDVMLRNIGDGRRPFPSENHQTDATPELMLTIG
jgi:hypothetical protein